MTGEVRVQPAGTTTVVLHGELDLVTIEELRALLAQACDQPLKRLIVDIADVSFLDLTSLSAILATADGLREHGGDLLLRGASSRIRKICAILNADDVLGFELPLQRSATA